MSSQFDDPRQFPTRLEWPTTFEGAEEFPKWDAKFVDLDELPIDEYMKPMPVNVVSGGTNPGPGPEPTPSGETKFYAIFVASGETVARVPVTSGQTVPSDKIPIPYKEGYTFSGWTPDPETTVMTADTTFNGEFIEEEKPSTYCDILPSGSVIDYTSMSAITFEDAKDGKTVNFIIPFSQEFADEFKLYDDGEIEEEDWENWKADWIANNTLVVRIIAPSNGYNLTVTETSGAKVTLPEPTQTTINGIEYMCYDYNGITDTQPEPFYPNDASLENRTYTVKITVDEE